jgi:hypothetical protein
MDRMTVDLDEPAAGPVQDAIDAFCRGHALVCTLRDEFSALTWAPQCPLRPATAWPVLARPIGWPPQETPRLSRLHPLAPHR